MEKGHVGNEIHFYRNQRQRRKSQEGASAAPRGAGSSIALISAFFFSLIVNSGPFEQKTAECPLSRSALLHFLSLKCPSLVDCDCYYIRNSQFRETQRQWQRSDTRGRNAPRPKAATFSTKHLLQSPGLWAPAQFNTGYYYAHQAASMPEPVAMPAVLIPSGTTENKLRYKQLDQDAYKMRSVADGG